MSILIFPAVVDLITAATPSSGYALAYDLDGIFKQKDSLGVIKSINQGISDVLSINNDTGTFSIKLGTSSTIESLNGNSQLSFDYSGNPSTIFLSTDYGAGSEGYLQIATGSVGLYSNLGDNTIFALSNLYLQSTGDVYLSGQNEVEIISDASGVYYSKISMYPDSIRIGIYDSYFGSNNEESIAIFNTSTQSHSTTSDDKWPVIISSKNSTVDTNVKNSVIIGGESMTASSDATVYLGTNVNINNAYTLPSTDGPSGYILKTDGSGSVTWQLDTSVQTLAGVLSYGNETSTYDIVMGTSTVISSNNSNNTVHLDVNDSIILSTDGGTLTTPYFQISTDGLTFSSTTLIMDINQALISVASSQGLQYSDDYTGSFVSYSLVSKQYVDDAVKNLYSYQTVFVDPQYGDDTTGTIERFDKPFATVSAATIAILLSYSSGTIFLKRGEYTETVNLENGFNYYCEPDVLFTDGGFSDVAASATSSVYGYARFEGSSPSLLPLRLENGSTVNFEFDRCNNEFYFGRIWNSTANIKGNYIYSRADNGLCISIRGTSEANILISEKILSAYKTISVTNNFSGNLYIECPEIECDTVLGNYGYVPETSVALYVEDTTTGNIEIKGNLSNISPDLVYTISNPDYTTRFDGACAIFAGSVTINGKIDGGYTKGIYIGGTVNVGQVRTKGDIWSYRESIIVNSDIVSTYLSEGTLKSWGSGSMPYVVNVIGTSSTTYIKDAVVYNTSNNSSLIYIMSTQSTTGIYDTLGWSTGTGGEFVYTTQSVNVGFHSVRSKKDNNVLVTDTFSPSGFIYDSELFIPNF